MRSTGHAWSYKAWCSAVISCFSTALIGAFRSLLFHSVICSLGGPLSHGSPVLVFFDRGHPRIWNFYSAIPVDVVRVKSSMNCLFDSARVLIRVTINKLYFVPKNSLCVTCSSDQRSVRSNINQWKSFQKKNFHFVYFSVLWNFFLLLLRDSLLRVVERVLTQNGNKEGIEL